MRKTSGQRAFEELLQGKMEQPSVDTFLSTRPPLDAPLWKIAAAIDPGNPSAAYGALGGAFDPNVKLSSELKPAKAGGLKPGVKLFPHQKEAVDKIIAKDGSLLLSHPVGSGKTATSIAAFETMRDKGMAERALVVAPASLRTNFLENGIKRFTTSKGAIFGNAQEVASGSHRSTDDPDPRAQYHIVGYELFRTDPKKYIEAAGADTVIYDELHKIKNEGVLTSKAIRDARKYHRNFIGMTGSIVSNTPADIVPLVDAMTDGKHLLGNKTTFEARFVETKDTGAKSLRHPSVLRALLSPYVHHIDPADLDTNAPKKLVEEVQVEMSPYQRDLYKFIKKDLDPLTELRLKMGVSKLNNAQLNDMFAKLLRLRQVSNSLHTMDERLTPEQSATQTPKIKRILDDVQEHIKETPDAQCIIHTNMIQGGVDVLTAGLKARGIDHALFIGKGNPGVTEKSRQYGVEQYRKGEKKVIVLSAAGGEGLDLPNTTFMAMTDGHFNPEKINQAEARGIRAGGLAHRKPGDRQVLIRRYLSVMPATSLTRVAEIAQGIGQNINPKSIMARISAGGPIFFNPLKREVTTDQWIYNLAKGKAGLNKELQGAIKQSSLEVPEFPTHEAYEEWLLDGVEKHAGVADALMWGVEHPRLITTPVGALVGAGVGLMSGGTPPRTAQEARQDPNAPLRNRLSATVGGALGGAMQGAITAGRPSSVWEIPAQARMGAAAGRAIASLFAPPAAVPASVHELLGKRQNYSDRALFEAYWSRFGKELEVSGVDAKVSDSELEARFVSALKDLYTSGKTTGRTNKTMSEKGLAKGKRNYILGSLAATPFAMAAGAGPNLTGQAVNAVVQGARGKPVPSTNWGEAAISAIPTTTAMLGALAGGYREHFIDPGVSVESKQIARTRSRFSEEQLKDLLRGKAVEEIKTKQHVIK